MSDSLPDPPITPDVDLRGLAYMPLLGHHLFKSDFHAKCTDAEWRAGITLWWAAWNQVPAGSLPNDDVVLCRLAEFGKDMKSWRKVKANALHGFSEFSDGRLYHRLLVEQALLAYEKRVKERERKRKWRESRPVTEGEWRELRLAVFKRDGFKCVKCSSTEDIEADHIIPASQGGATSLANMQTLCRRCNASKRNGIPRRAPSAAFDGDGTATGRGHDADVPADETRRDETGRDGTGRDNEVTLFPQGAERPAGQRNATAKREGPSADNVAAWQAYADGYFTRYGAEPVRNAKTNGQIAAFVRRVGADEAPSIAAFYTSHPGRYYVERGHSVDCLVADAEKLRTEWATGRRVTSTSAAQGDRMAGTMDAAERLIARMGAQ